MGGGGGRVESPKNYRASISNLKKISCKNKRTKKNIEQDFRVVILICHSVHSALLKRPIVYIFWYKIGIEQVPVYSIPKIVVLYFFTPTPMMNMHVKN